MSEYAQKVEEYQTLMNEITQYKQVNKAMDARLTLKNNEILILQQRTDSAKQTLSLQIHAIKEMQKPLLLDPSVNTQFISMRNYLGTLRTELSNQEATRQSLSKVYLPKANKSLDRWQKNTDEMYRQFEDYAQGRVQDIHLQLGLSDLKIQELKRVLDEYKQVANSLEKEASAMDATVRNLEGKYKVSLEQLGHLRQEHGAP